MIHKVAIAVFALWVALGGSLSRADTSLAAHVGFVGVSGASDAPLAMAALWERLRELGWEEGSNLVVERRWAHGRAERLPAFMDELVARKVDVIVTATTPAALAAKRATKTIPIVAMVIGDPVGTGLAASLARPGGNLTGLSRAYSEGFAGKWLELLRDCVPHLKTVAVVFNPQNLWSVQQRKDLETNATVLKLKLQFMELTGLDSLQSSFVEARRNAEAVIVLADPLTLHYRGEIAAVAVQHRLPMLSPLLEFVDAGGLIGYGVDTVAESRRAADYVDKILRGDKPDDLPIEQATQYTLVVNLKTAKVLGLRIPASVLAHADRVIR